MHNILVSSEDTNTTNNYSPQNISVKSFVTAVELNFFHEVVMYRDSV